MDNKLSPELEQKLQKKHGWGEFSAIKVVKKAIQKPEGWKEQEK